MSEERYLEQECDNIVKIQRLERQLDLAKVNERDLNDIITALNDELSGKERQLEEAREVFRLVNLENQLLHEEVNRLNENINELKESE